MLCHKDDVGINAGRLSNVWFCLFLCGENNNAFGTCIMRVKLQHLHAGSYLMVSTAVATYASKHSVYYLNKTQDEFNSTKCQEDGKQRHIPFHNMLGFNALGPWGSLQKVPMKKRETSDTWWHLMGCLIRYLLCGVFLFRKKNKGMN